MRLLKLGLATTLVASICFASCGDSHRRPTVQGSAGQAGQGGHLGQAGEGIGGSEDFPEAVRCGSAMCRPIVLPDGSAMATCCADPSEGICGAEVSGLPGMGCLPLTQPGELDPSCPGSPAGAAGLPLPPLLGCCNPTTQQCGYLISDFGGLLPIAPGCVDATLLGASAPRACGADDGSGGRGPDSGEGGAGGTDTTSGGADTTNGGVGGADAGNAGASGGAI